MSTSGSYNFTLNRDEILIAALRKVKAVDLGNTPAPEQMDAAAQALNLIVKSLQNQNVFLWAAEWVTKTLTASSEVTGTDGNIYTCIRSHTSATANKPVTGADYLTYWVERGETGGTWAADTAYTSVADFDLEADTIAIESLSYRNNSSDNPIQLVDKFEFFSTYDKTVIGTPIKGWLERKRDTPHLWLWPIPNQTDYIVNYQRIRKLQDFDADSDNADFPERWIEFLIYRLAVALSPEYTVPIADRQLLKIEANELFILAKRGNNETQDEEYIRSAY